MNYGGSHIENATFILFCRDKGRARSHLQARGGEGSRWVFVIAN